MSYRTHLFVVSKTKLNQLKKLNVQELWKAIDKEPDESEIDEETKEPNPPYWRDVLKYADGEELIELGDVLFYKKYQMKPYDYLTEVFEDETIQEWYNDDDTELMIAKPELLDAIIDVYRKRIEDVYTQLLKEDSENPKDDFGHPLEPQLKRLQKEIRDQLYWLNYINDSDSKWSLASSWLYLHEIFNLIHIKKIFNPKKELLIWAAA